MTTWGWRAKVGVTRQKVTVGEYLPREGVLYLAWRDEGNWQYRSLGERLADTDGEPLVGRALERKKQWAIGQAEQHLAKLLSGTLDPRRGVTRPPITLGETWALIADEEMGKYPVDTPHRREVKRELFHAVRILGKGTAWVDVRLDQLTRLWRVRITELRRAGEVGVRGAEITVSRFLTVAGWLRDRERIPKDACLAPRTWKLELRKDWRHITGETRDAEPDRPRHTLVEMRKILAKAADVDPRFDLMLGLGAELRLGQVIRGRRLDLRRSDEDRGGKKLVVWRFRVYGAGNKGGTIIELTAGQIVCLERALAGYLREFEAAFTEGKVKDYVLFPGGKLRGRVKGAPVAAYPAHIERAALSHAVIDNWWRAAESLAGVKSVKGRGAYGARRAGVDGAKTFGVSREALQVYGGWSDSQVPDRIYADQHLESAITEAAEVRAKVRGEAP